MPGVIKYLTDPNSRTAAARAQEELVRAERDERAKMIERNWKYYKGDHKKHLTDDGSGTDDNVIFNLYGLSVDKGVSDLVGTGEDGVIKGPNFDIVGEERPIPAIVRRVGRAVRGKPQEFPEEIWLDRTWEANNKELFLHNMAVSSGVTGHVFIKVIPSWYPNPDDDTHPFPRFVMLNTAHVTAFWEDGDKDDVLAYRIQYGVEGNAKRQDIVWEGPEETTSEFAETAEMAGRWVIYDYEQKDRRRTWVQTNEPQTWAYDWPPIVQWQNLPNPNGFYGCEDVETANRRLNDNLNFTSSNIQRIIKHHASPKTVGTGIDDGNNAVIATAIDGFWTTPNDKANIYNLEMQSDLSSSMNFAKTLRRGFFDGTRELDPATVEDRLGDLTNFGLRVLYGDKVKKTGSKRMMAGMGLTDINQRVLELGGFGTSRKVAIKWPAVLPSDPLIQAQALAIDVEHGLSQESYLDARGWDAELEAVRREQQRAEGVQDQVVVAQAQRLGQIKAGAMSGGGAMPTDGMPMPTNGNKPMNGKMT